MLAGSIGIRVRIWGRFRFRIGCRFRIWCRFRVHLFLFLIADIKGSAPLCRDPEAILTKFKRHRNIFLCIYDLVFISILVKPFRIQKQIPYRSSTGKIQITVFRCIGILFLCKQSMFYVDEAAPSFLFLIRTKEENGILSLLIL